MNKNIWQKIDIRVAAVGLSLLASCFSAFRINIPNDDAYAYVRTAEIFLSDGVNAAMQNYAWVGYSLLIALVSQLGLDLFLAAYLINALFYSLLVYSFISIVKLLKASKSVTLLAAICVLLYPPLNEFRYEIVRDIAVWALALFALWHFLLFNKSHQLQNLFFFSVSLLFASCFRPETAIYLFSVPFALLFNNHYSKKERYKQLLLSLGINLGLIGLLILAFAIKGLNIFVLLSDFVSVYDPFISNNLNPNAINTSAISTEIFGEHAASYSEPYLALFLTSGLFAILIVKLFEGIGGPFFWVLLYGSFKRLIKVERNILIPVLFFLLTNILIVLGFILVTRYVSTRYSMLFCLLLALFVPLILDYVTSALENSAYRNVGMRVLILFFGYCAFDSFISFGISKDFVLDSVDWVITESDIDTRLLTNNQTIAYNSGKIENYDQIGRFLSEQEIINANSNDFIAIEMHYEMTELVEKETIKPLLKFRAAFPSIEEQRIVIYQRIAR